LRNSEYSQGSFPASELTAALLNKGSPACNGRAYPLNEKRLRDVLDYMRSHLDAPVPLDDLAEIADVSKFHLIRTFKATLGMAPGKYHMQLRLIEARSRLREGHNIQDVSFDLGFYDQSHFINAFRRVLGVSPLRFVASGWHSVESDAPLRSKAENKAPVSRRHNLKSEKSEERG
jgi:AraC-like DNA-binding protein